MVFVLRKMSCAFAFALMLAQTAAFGETATFERVQLLCCQTDLNPGVSTVLEIPDGWRHVRKLWITAESFHGDSTLQVFVNGDEKGKAFVPRMDPNYVVTVAETASRIVIKNENGPGVLRIKSVQADLSYRTVTRDPLPDTWNGGTSGGIRFPTRNEAASFGRDAVEVVNLLKPFTDEANEYVTYLLPIKISAGRVIAIANARGNGSKLVREALEVLVAQIEFGDEYVEQMLRTPGAYNHATRLLELKESIKDWMD